MLLLTFLHPVLDSSKIGSSEQYGPPFLPGDVIWDNGAACGRIYLLKCISGIEPGVCVSDEVIQVTIVDYSITSVSRPPNEGSTMVLSAIAFGLIANSTADSTSIEFKDHIHVLGDGAQMLGFPCLNGKDPVIRPAADIVPVLRPTESVLRGWVTRPTVNIVSVLRPTENVLCDWVNCEVTHPDTNIAFVLRPTKDVLPWLDMEAMSTLTDESLIRKLNVRAQRLNIIQRMFCSGDAKHKWLRRAMEQERRCQVLVVTSLVAYPKDYLLSCLTNKKQLLSIFQKANWTCKLKLKAEFESLTPKIKDTKVELKIDTWSVSFSAEVGVFNLSVKAKFPYIRSPVQVPHVLVLQAHQRLLKICHANETPKFGVTTTFARCQTTRQGLNVFIASVSNRPHCEALKTVPEPSQQSMGLDRSVFVYNPDYLREQFTGLVIQRGLPFNHFDHEKTTRVFQKIMQPKYNHVSGSTLKQLLIESISTDLEFLDDVHATKTKQWFNDSLRKQHTSTLENALDFEDEVLDAEVQENEATPLSDKEIALDATSQGTMESDSGGEESDFDYNLTNYDD
uniref:Uncharacterized protein n=1 Tax=Tanacetum cinerariifolium TaxID=118510 RepID=A0A6L2M3R2_TANCI|nr:hypothetical protein [Tanacetum cinerariifolium]